MLKELINQGLIAQLFDNQPDSVVWFAPVLDKETNVIVVDFEAQYANHAAARILGVSRSEVVGTRLLATKLMDKDSIKLIFDQCHQVYQSGEPIEYTYYSPGFDSYFNVQRSKVEGGILSITRDRTQEVKYEMRMRKQEKKYQSVIEHSTDGVILLEPVKGASDTIVDFKMIYCNRYAVEVGKLPLDYEGKSLIQVLPHLKNTGQFDWHVQVFRSGTPLRYETTFRTREGEEYGWFIVTLSRADDVVVSRFTDITERKKFEETISDQANTLDRIINSSLNSILTCEAIRDDKGEIVDFRYIRANEMYIQSMELSSAEVIGNTMVNLFPNVKYSVAFQKYREVAHTGIPARFEVYYESEGLNAWYDISTVRIHEDYIVITFADITEQKKSWLEIERQKILLDNLLMYSPSGITIVKGIRDHDGKVVDVRHVVVNEQAEKYIGFPKELLLSKTNRELDPGFAESKLLQDLAKTFETGETAYTDYHLPTGQWIEGAAAKMDEDHLICIINDVTTFKESQQKMNALVQELQRSNKNLEDFTYAASHDLKEPIRKIHVFTERLKLKLGAKLEQDDLAIFERIERSTDRMRLLIEDLLEYSHVSLHLPEKEVVDLNGKLQVVLSDLELAIKEKNAIIHSEQLPVIKGYRRQLQQLFQNLISNAIKYNKPGVHPIINITCRNVTGAESGMKLPADDQHKKFYLIQVKDNGIGFEPQEGERIFQMFTRLHGNYEYTGTGVGLSIAKKVVENHDGYISASGEPGKGATFSILLPE